MVLSLHIRRLSDEQLLDAHLLVEEEMFGVGLLNDNLFDADLLVIVRLGVLWSCLWESRGGDCGDGS